MLNDEGKQDMDADFTDAGGARHSVRAEFGG